MITVHIQQVGIARFDGPNAQAEAKTWARQAVRDREREFDIASLVDADGLSKKMRSCLGGVSEAEVRKALRKAGSEGKTVKQLVAITGRSQPTVHLVLQALAVLGETQAEKPDGSREKIWRLVEAKRIAA